MVPERYVEFILTPGACKYDLIWKHDTIINQADLEPIAAALVKDRKDDNTAQKGGHVTVRARDWNDSSACKQAPSMINWIQAQEGGLDRASLSTVSGDQPCQHLHWDSIYVKNRFLLF